MNAPIQFANPSTVRDDCNWVDRDNLFDIERFLYREARLLDEERWREWWQDYLTEDIHYYLPIRPMVYREARKQVGSNPGSAIFNDNRDMLDKRIKRLESGLAWMEDPQNYIRRYLSNVDAEWIAEGKEARVYSNFIIYRNRRQRDETILWGARNDVLRVEDGRWKVAKRTVLVDQRVTLDKNLFLFV